MGGFKKVLKGAAFHKADYVELLSLLYYFTRLASTKGAMALEAHIEKPAESPAFQKFPKIIANHHACAIICDYLRMVGMNADDPHQIEDVMGRELKKTLHEELHPSHAIQAMADALPALGIVAAVLGVIKTMSHINEPPAVLGAMIGGALGGHLPGRADGLRHGGPGRRPDEERGGGGGEVPGGHPRRARHPPARQRAAGQRRNRAQDGAERAHAELCRVGNRGAGCTDVATAAGRPG